MRTVSPGARPSPAFTTTAVSASGLCATTRLAVVEAGVHAGTRASTQPITAARLPIATLILPRNCFAAARPNHLRGPLDGDLAERRAWTPARRAARDRGAPGRSAP